MIDDKELEKKINEKLASIYDEEDVKQEKEEVKEAVIEEKNNRTIDTEKYHATRVNNDTSDYKSDYSDDEEEMLEAVDKELKEYNNSSEYKPTTMIKLDDVSEDERFFDDFFDD